MIYFDNAATTYPKPPTVIKGVIDALRECGNPGRGAHKPAMRAAEEIYACRKAAAELFGASPERVIITSGATHSLNMAINACRERDGAVLISELEHNSVLRPSLASGREVRVFSSALSHFGEERTAEILASIDRLSYGASVLVCTAASNICGAVMPISDIGKYCRERGILFIVDGAQAGGVYDIDVERDCIDVLCLPGHKGLYGPMGCGLMILGEDVELPPFMLGGSGVDSRAKGMPELPPERYEAGTLPVALAAGLRHGIEFIRYRGAHRLFTHERMLARRLIAGLSDIPCKIYAQHHNGTIVLFSLDGISDEETARRLSDLGICTRAGLHCAPLAHGALGSEGAVRVSFGAFNTADEVDILCREIRKLG